MQVQRKYVYLFQTAFNCAIEELPPNLQLEVINLQFKDKLKGKYQDDLVQFYKFLPSSKYIQRYSKIYSKVIYKITLQKNTCN